MGVALLLALLTTAPATAQTGGEIGGAVTDTQGFAVPGVTVTLEGEALIAPLTAVTLVDGSYLFRALGRGAYDLTFEIPGFRALVDDPNWACPLNALPRCRTASASPPTSGIRAAGPTRSSSGWTSPASAPTSRSS